MEKLALLGGKPVRTKPFPSNVIVDASERKEILEVLKRREFSRFMGSPTEDIQKVLRLKSAQAADYNPQYFTFLGGRKVRQFERDFADQFHSDYAITVNSATSGLSTVLGAMGVEPGDEVITTCMSFNATATSVLAFNAIPVFCDVSPRNFCIDPARIEALITKRTKAILVVHLLGFAADMDRIMAIAKKHGLKVIEDCAQSPGTLYKGRPTGTIGDAGVFSLQETKNITTGEGGMILTDDAELAARCRMIRNHGESIPDDGWDDASLANLIGFNFRMTELTAALGVAQLKKLSRNNKERNANAAFLRKQLAGLPGLSISDAPEGTVCHILPLLYDESATGVPRVKIVHALRAEGIPVGTGYTRLMHENPLFRRRIAFGTKGFPFSLQNGSAAPNTPIAEDLVRRKFLWFYHVNRPCGRREMTDVAAAFRKVFASLDALKAWDPSGKRLAYKW